MPSALIAPGGLSVLTPFGDGDCSLPNYIRRNEHGIEVSCRSRRIVGNRQSRATDKEQVGPGTACRELLRQVIQECADVFPPEASRHARSSAPLVMNTPRRRNEDGDSTSA